MSTELRDWQDKATFFYSYSMLLICSIKLIKKKNRETKHNIFWYILRFLTSFKGAKGIKVISGMHPGILCNVIHCKKFALPFTVKTYFLFLKIK